MNRLLLAFVCFWRILLGRPLPAQALPKPLPLPLPPPLPETKPEDGALLMLSVLQREGRLLDFLMEKIDGYEDAQVGAAVRAIHAGCKKAIGEHLALEPVLAGAEETPVTLEAGYDA